MDRLRNNTTFWRGFVLGGVMLAALGLLWQGLGQPPPVYAQIPDSGAQRQRMIQEMTTSNKKLTEIVRLLEEIRDQNAADARAGRPAKPTPTRP